MFRHQHVERLAEVSLFSDCSHKELQQVSKASTEMDFPPGTTLTKEGHLAREAFVLVAGTALVRRHSRTVTELGPGSLVGELALLNPQLRTRTATVEAATDVRALVFAPGDFVALVYVPSIARKVWVAMAVKVGDLDRMAYGQPRPADN